MPRYIDADLIEYKAICVPMLDGVLVRTKQLDGFYAIKKDIEAIPTADVQEVKHAKNLCEDYPWAQENYCRLGDNNFLALFECSLCNWCDDDTTTGSTSVYNYCPNCGAKMDGGKHET